MGSSEIDWRAACLAAQRRADNAYRERDKAVGENPLRIVSIGGPEWLALAGPALGVVLMLGSISVGLSRIAGNLEALAECAQETTHADD